MNEPSAFEDEAEKQKFRQYIEKRNEVNNNTNTENF